MSLLVLQPGIESRIVDLGRSRTRSLGIAIGGAADRRSYALGNALVGNPPDTAALEIALMGPRLRAEATLGCVLFGAPFDVHLDGYRIGTDHAFTMHPGAELQIGGAALGMRAYLCVRGGFDVPTILASRSAFAPIKEGDLLPSVPGTVPSRYCPYLGWTDAPALIVAALPGLQSDWFREEEFYAQTFVVTPASNRMGLRVKGTPLSMPQREMLSEPVCPGAVQVTPDGQCIVLGVDGQTIGGYPKIAQVIGADLDALGQLRPGQSMRFTKITMADAIQRDRRLRSELREWTRRLRLSLDAFP